jgi:transmembrane sensor
MGGVLDEICVLFFQGRATPDEERELKAWREVSAQNEERFQQLQRLWEVSGVVTVVDEAYPVPNTSRFLEGVANRPPPIKRRTPFVAGWMATAAVLFLSLWAGHAWVSRDVAPEYAVDAEFRTGSGELATAALGDGTVVRLAPNSRLLVRFSGEERRLNLEGRAFFSVASDPRPLEVHYSQGRVYVLGTRFEANTFGDELTVLVLQGLVGLEVGRNQLELQAGDLGHAAGRSIRSVTRVENPEALQDWLGVFLAFEATPLRQVARELQARLGVQLELTDPSLEERTVTGWFTDEDGNQVADVICRIAELDCEVQGNVVRASPLLEVER